MVAGGQTTELIDQNLQMFKSHNVDLDSRSGAEAKEGSEFAGLRRSKSFVLTELGCS